MKLNVSTGNSRMEKHWNLQKMALDEFRDRIKETTRTAETAAQYLKLPKPKQDSIKDIGGFVLGKLKGGRRKKDCVISRSALTLDMDYAKPETIEEVEMLFDFKCWFYSTHKNTPEKPRLRLIIPLSRDVTSDEYTAIARKVAAEIDIELFDDTTYEPERLMYWPSTSANSEYLFKEIDGEILNPDIILAKYQDWHNTEEWPVSNRQQTVVRRDIKKQADPLTKEGIVGVFCRTYTVEDAIDKFMPDIYRHSTMPGRYDYIPADSTAGVVIYEDKFAYSHHATDPACGHLMNAFDVIRIHKFGSKDSRSKEDTESSKLPSFKAMSEFAAKDDVVKVQMAKERETKVLEDFGAEDWEKKLEYEPRSMIVKNSLGNLLLILTNDTNLQGIKYNSLARQIYGDNTLPWERPHPAWRDADTAQLVAYIDKAYGTFSSRNYELALTKVADDRSYHPIHEYLESLPKWDGVKRVEELLIKYFGAEDSIYTRTVTKKTLVAAVARIYSPGIKYDSMLVLNGPTDLGKSTFFARLAGEWFSDSLSFADMGKGKDAAEKIQGVWIVEIPELAGLSKMDVNNIKGFLSRQDDQYRPSYGRSVESHLRQCIIVGSTNAENTGFLRDTTGNRRFWVIRVGGCKIRGWDLPVSDVPQIWAESKHYWEKGEKLYLDGKVAQQAKAEQTTALETDEREGIVREYLDLLLPENWYEMDIYARRNFFSNEDPIQAQGTFRRDFVSNMEIWCECFGNNRGSFSKQSDSYQIRLIMQKIGGWEYSGKKRKIKSYGAQYVWVRAKNLID